jgi:hypothetical protein
LRTHCWATLAGFTRRRFACWRAANAGAATRLLAYQLSEKNMSSAQVKNVCIGCEPAIYPTAGFSPKTKYLLQINYCKEGLAE